MAFSHLDPSTQSEAEFTIPNSNSKKKDPLGQLAARLAHDLNVPIASILAYAEELIELAKERYGIKGFNQLVEYVEIIQKEAYHCKEIVEKMLSYAKGLEIQLETVNIHQLIEECLENLKPMIKEKNITIKTDFDANLPNITTDPTGLRRVILNVLCNAEEAIPDTGEIAVRTSSRDRFITIEISDTGVGIDEAYLQKIFDPYFTTKKRGKGGGLGLAICNGILKTLKAQIAVSSKKGEGTVVTISMPKKIKVIMA